MKWVVSPHSKQPLGDLLLSLWNFCKVGNFLASRAISSLGMLSYCSSEAVAKEDKANSKVDETVVLVGLASWPPARALVIKALLVRRAHRAANLEEAWNDPDFFNPTWRPLFIPPKLEHSPDLVNDEGNDMTQVS
jgi:hypothetical protein